MPGCSCRSLDVGQLPTGVLLHRLLLLFVPCQCHALHIAPAQVAKSNTPAALCNMQGVLQPPSPPLIDDAPRSPYAFTALDLQAQHRKDGAGRDSDDDDWSVPPEVELANNTRMLSATIGALLTSFVVTPFDVVKTRLQAQLHPITPADTATHSASHPHSSYPQYQQPQNPQHPHYHPTASSQVSSSLHSHPSAASVSIRPLAVGVTHLSSSQLLDRCSHVRLQTGFMDTWCNRCTITAPHGARLQPPASFAYGFAPRVASVSAASAAAPAVDMHLNGTLDAVTKLIRHEGIGSLWRGLSPQLLLSIPSTVVYFWAYDKLKMSLSSVTAHPTASTTTAAMTSYVSLLSPLIAGTSARAITTILVSPIELIRTRTQSLSHNASMWSIAKDEVRKGGIRSLWRGANPTLWRDVPFSAFYWTSYEWIKVRLLRSGMHRVSEVRRRGGDVDVAYQRMLMWTSFVAGASSGMIAAVFTHPFDLVKTRRQIEMYNLSPACDSANSANAGHNASSAATPALKGRAETFGVLRLIVTEEGWRGLFTGLLARMSKIAPACAIMISTYELSKAKFGQMHREGREGKERDAPPPLLGGMRKEMS